MRPSVSLFLFALIAACPLLVHDAAAQDGSMKVCGERWQAAKASGASSGTTWPKFLAECRTTLAATPAAPTSAPPAKPVSTASIAPAASAKPAAAPVFPATVASKFAELRPSQGRQKTCSEQYQANKATGGNAGLRWLEKGGGYWSLCNKKLKGA